MTSFRKLRSINCVVAGRTGAALSADGRFCWIVNNENHRLARFDLASGTWRIVGEAGEALGQFQHPFLLAAAANGDVLVSDVLNARVQVVGADGAAVASIGVFGVRPGELYRPTGVAVDAEGLVWIADSVIGVIQIFASDGSPLDVLRNDAGQPLHLAHPMGVAFDAQGALNVAELRADRIQKFEIKRPAKPLSAQRPARPTVGVGDQIRGCTVCHLERLPPFAEGRDSPLMPRPADTLEQPAVSQAETCLSCHDGAVVDSRRRVWAEHGHRTGSIPPPNIVVPPNLPLVDGKLACRTCHSAHVSGGPQGDIRTAIFLRVRNDASELCMSCHVDKTRGPRFGTHPTGGPCSACHLFHRFARELTPTAADPTGQCITCHSPGQCAQNRSLGDLNHPLRCATCHNPHDPRNGKFLRAAPQELCAKCHTPQTQLAGGPHDPNRSAAEWETRLGSAEWERLAGSHADPACLACHRPHGDATSGLWRVAPTLTLTLTPTITPTATAAPAAPRPDATCIACHADAD